MAFTAYHNIDGSSAERNELLAIGDIPRQKITCINITNTHDTAAATIDLFIFKDSTDTTVSETYYFLKNYKLSFGDYLMIDNNDLLNFDNTTDTGYSLYIAVGSTDTVDVMIRKE